MPFILTALKNVKNGVWCNEE